MKHYALIVAGGSGTRMNTDVPKQFLLLNNRPILMHTIDRFFQYNSEIEIIVVLPEPQITYWKNLCEHYHFGIKHKLVCGGDTRFMSVKNGLESIDGDGIVAIHDGVRPLVSDATLERCFNTAKQFGNALPVMPVVESLRFVDEKGNHAVDRSQFNSVQTPQVFRVNEIKMAYNQPYHKKFTDDATVLEGMNIAINLVVGNNENIKITTPLDLEVATLFQNIVK